MRRGCAGVVDRVVVEGRDDVEDEFVVLRVFVERELNEGRDERELLERKDEREKLPLERNFASASAIGEKSITANVIHAVMLSRPSFLRKFII